jgi:hypothetical protein
MKKIVIVNAYVNNVEREQILFDALVQLKKTGYDVLLTYNSIITSERVLKLCKYSLYNDDNFMLPREFTPTLWFADDKDYVELLLSGINYVIVKKLNLALHLARSLDYESFLFLEYDNIFDEKDFIKINNIFDILENKKAVFFNFSAPGIPVSPSNPLAFETMIFGGNVNFFLDNIALPNTFEKWKVTPNYMAGGSYTVLEWIIPVLFQNYMDQVEFLETERSTTFFPNSRLDASSVSKDFHILLNQNEPNRPALFIYGRNHHYKAVINGTCVCDQHLIKNAWFITYFDLTDDDVVIETYREGVKDTIVVNRSNIQNIQSGYRRNIR